MAPPTTPSWGADFRRLWAATAASQAGSAVAVGALPFIAVTVLDVSDLQVSLLVAVAGIASAVLALPVGPWVEHRRKRPVMIGADLVRAAALLSLPVAHLLGSLTYVHLLLVAAVTSLGLVVESSAGSAHLKALVPREGRTSAAGRLDTTSWIAASAGPTLGGALLGVVGATVTVAINAAALVLAAAGITRLRTPEPEPPARAADHHWRRELLTGWRVIWGEDTLRPLLVNALVFGAMIVGASPLITVLMLRDLDLAPWQYGLALGLPCLGGILGAMLAPRIERRLGRGRALLGLGTARTFFILPIALAPTGWAGLGLIVVCDTLLLLAAGAFNPLFVAHRMDSVPDALMSRTSAAWSISARVAQPLGVTLLGLLAVATSTRVAIATAGVVLLLSPLALPWRALTSSLTPEMAPRGDRSPAG